MVNVGPEGQPARIAARGANPKAGRSGWKHVCAYEDAVTGQHPKVPSCQVVAIQVTDYTRHGCPRTVERFLAVRSPAQAERPTAG